MSEPTRPGRARVAVVALVWAMGGCEASFPGGPAGALRQAVLLPGTGQQQEEQLGAALAVCPNGTLLIGGPGARHVLAAQSVDFYSTTEVYSGDSDRGRIGEALACTTDLQVIGAPNPAGDGSVTLCPVRSDAGCHTEVALGLPVGVLAPRSGAPSRAVVIVPEPNFPTLARLVLRFSDRGTGAATAPFPVLSDSPLAMAVGDVNGDGVEDVAVASVYGVWISWGLEDGGIGPPTQLKGTDGGPQVLSNPPVLAIGRLVPDAGVPQLLVGTTKREPLTVYRVQSQGQGASTMQVLYPVGSIPGTADASAVYRSLAIGDWDGDGTMELFVGLPELDLVKRYSWSWNVQSYSAELATYPDTTPCTGLGPTCSAGGGTPSMAFGAALALASVSVNGVSVGRLIVGAPNWSATDEKAGRYFVLEPPAPLPDAGSSNGGIADGGRVDAGASDGGGPATRTCANLPDGYVCARRCSQLSACQDGACVAAGRAPCPTGYQCSDESVAGRCVLLRPVFEREPPRAACHQRWSYTPDAGVELRWSLAGARPPGLGFDEATGALDWLPTPPAGPVRLELTAANDSGATLQVVSLEPGCPTQYQFLARGCASADSLLPTGGLALLVLARRRRLRLAYVRSTS